jgi:hypothetical protein
MAGRQRNLIIEVSDTTGDAIMYASSSPKNTNER